MSAETEARSRPCPRAASYAPHKEYRDADGTWYCPHERSVEMAEADQRRREERANRTSRVEVWEDADIGAWIASAVEDVHGEPAVEIATASGKHAAEALANLAKELLA